MAMHKIVFALLCVALVRTESAEDYASVADSSVGSLELVHVVFRHGDRTPEIVYPNDPYADEPYFPYRLGQLTNKGKQTAYNIGIALRQKYGNFINETFTPELIEANASPIERCQASMQLVLAGLFPAKNENVWNQNLNWQPIPYTTIPQMQNKLFWTMLSCPNFLSNYVTYQKTGLMTEAFKEYTNIMEFISENSGMINDPLAVGLAVYSTIKSEVEWGLTLPSWAQSVWPEPLTTISAKSWTQVYATQENRALGAGFLMSKIINDTYSTINGDDDADGRKLYLYAGHDTNIVAILSWLGVFQEHNPAYGAYIVFEVYNLLGTRFVKILHQNYEFSSPVPIFIPSCGYYCPLKSFENLYADYINPHDLCG